MIYLDFPTNGKQSVNYNIQANYALHGWVSSKGSAFMMSSNPTILAKGFSTMTHPIQSYSSIVESSKGSFSGYGIGNSVMALNFYSGV